MDLVPGQQIWSVATGKISIFRPSSRKAVEFVIKQEGFIGVFPTQDKKFTVWFFDTKNNAVRARNRMEAKGIKCGNHVCLFTVDDDGVPVFDEEQIK